MAKILRDIRKLDPDETWRMLHRIADKAAPDLVRAFLIAVNGATSQASLARVQRAISRKDYDAAIRAIPWDRVMQAQLRPAVTKALRDVLESAGEATALPVKGEISFDVTNPRVFDWIRRETGNLITAVSRETVAAVREVIRLSFEHGFGPRESANRILDFIGLNARQAGALDKYMQDLAKKGLPQARQEKLAEYYRNRLLRQRAMLIARTETMAAANEGWRIQISAAAKEGLIDAAEWEIKWLITPDDKLCVRCDTMTGARRPIDGVYTTGDGAGKSGPPLHPNCRCAERTVRVQRNQKAA